MSTGDRHFVLGKQGQAFAVADLLKDGPLTFARLRGDRPMAVIYSDPPWNPGNEKYWRRRAGAAVPVNYSDLLSAWCRCVVESNPDHVFCEQSVIEKHHGMLLDVIGKTPGWRWPLLKQWTVQYGHPLRPNVLMHFGSDLLRTDPSGMSGEAMTRRVFEGLHLAPGSLIGDPCVGLGTTSRIAHAFGHHCIGTELDTGRLGRTIKWILRAGYTEATGSPAPEQARPGATPADAVRAYAGRSADERVAVYNATQRALGELVADVSPDPAVAPRLLPVESIVANDYNPNRVASPELDLLESSMRSDGITMSVVVSPGTSPGEWLVVDGFHRRMVARDRLGRRYVPCSVIDRPLADRMASTVRHNRARGKHQVELMAALVKSLFESGRNDDQVASCLGMSVEELLRLRQMVGAARMLASETYSRSWGNQVETVDEEPEAEA